jgi:hypothetical protein
MNGQRSKTNNNGLSSGNIKKFASFFSVLSLNFTPVADKKGPEQQQGKKTFLQRIFEIGQCQLMVINNDNTSNGRNKKIYQQNNLSDLWS